MENNATSSLASGSQPVNNLYSHMKKQTDAVLYTESSGRASCSPLFCPSQAGIFFEAELAQEKDFSLGSSLCLRYNYMLSLIHPACPLTSEWGSICKMPLPGYTMGLHSQAGSGQREWEEEEKERSFSLRYHYLSIIPPHVSKQSWLHSLCSHPPTAPRPPVCRPSLKQTLSAHILAPQDPVDHWADECQRMVGTTCPFEHPDKRHHWSRNSKTQTPYFPPYQLILKHPCVTCYPA